MKKTLCDRCGAEVLHKDQVCPTIYVSRYRNVNEYLDLCGGCQKSLGRWLAQTPRGSEAERPEGERLPLPDVAQAKIK